ncbi:MAG: hypothetical protein JWP04_1794 [Belnapia sp.]|nr:hypothetical protein [Belnapia sp.]
MLSKKRLVVCCDGTWQDNDTGTDFTNVTRMARAVLPHDLRSAEPVAQIVYYLAGVGTSGGTIDRLFGGGLGLGLSRNVRDAYAFIAHNYCDGDEIFLFGFSRGAYTARSVAGLIGWSGLLHKRDMDDFALLWEGYRLRLEPGQSDPRLQFPDRHIAVPVQCVGVWDTVGSLGVPGNLDRAFAEFYEFYDTGLGAHVAHAFQALALDERRVDFAPAVWFQPPDAPTGQVLRQVWFAGVHSDIGGGYPDHGLADLTMAWMAGEVEPLLALDADYLALRQDRSACWGLGRAHDSAAGLFQLRPTKSRQPFAQQGGITGEALHASLAARQAPEAGCGPAPPPSAALQRVAADAPVAMATALEARLRWAATERRAQPPGQRPAPNLMGRILKEFGGG